MIFYKNDFLKIKDTLSHTKILFAHCRRYPEIFFIKIENPFHVSSQFIREICSSDLSRHGWKILIGTDRRNSGETAYRPDGKSANCSQGWVSTFRGWRRVRWPSELDSGQETLSWRLMAHPSERSPTRRPSK